MIYLPDFPFHLEGIDLKSAPGTLSNLSSTRFVGMRFIPQFAYVHLRTMPGPALTTSPGIRIGTNGTHNNVCPNFIPPTTIVVGQIGAIALASPLIAPPVDTTDLILEITQSAVGPTTMTGDVLVTGILIG